MSEDRIEEAAFHYCNDIIWLAYRYSGGDKEEVAYTAGWNFDGVKGASRYTLLRKVLNDKFGYDRARPILTRNGVTPCGFGSVFIGCDQVFIDADFPVEEKVVMQSFFMEYGLKCKEVSAPLQNLEDVSTRWSGPLGEELDDKEPGGTRALSIMTAGIGV